jgi:hypothetical protein
LYVIQQNLGAGYAIVPVPLDANNFVHRTSGSNITRAHAGNTVYRTPHAVAREAEPGASWPGDLTKMMFLPDGRLVPATPAAYDMLQGAPTTYSGLRGIVPAISMFAGGITGYQLSPESKGWGVLSGAIVGGLLGLLFR